MVCGGGYFYVCGLIIGMLGYFIVYCFVGLLVGVVVFKVLFDEMEVNWVCSVGELLLVDVCGVVFLVSCLEWKYCMLMLLVFVVCNELCEI